MAALRCMLLGSMVARAQGFNHGDKVFGLLTEPDCVIEGLSEKVVVPVVGCPPTPRPSQRKTWAGHPRGR
eukprot:1022576-Lingulodinium_polyedra.AAC.1